MVDFKKAGKEAKAKKKAGTSLVSMKDIEKMYAEESRAAADAAPAAGGTPVISTKGEQFQVGEELLPETLELIVVAEAAHNVYYDSPYDESNKTSPACFASAIAVKGVESLLVSHESSPNRQGGKDFKCQGCEMNAFGSAEVGKGKACSNYRKLCVVSAIDKGFAEEDTPLTPMLLQLPPTSLGDWGKFVHGLDRVEHRPPHGVIIKFAFDRRNPDANKRKRVIATGYTLITDVAIAQKVNALRREILDAGLLTQPLPVDNYVEPGQKQPTVAKGKAKPNAGRARPKAAPKGGAPKRAARF